MNNNIIRWLSMRRLNFILQNCGALLILSLIIILFWLLIEICKQIIIIIFVERLCWLWWLKSFQLPSIASLTVLSRLLVLLGLDLILVKLITRWISILSLFLRLIVLGRRCIWVLKLRVLWLRLVSIILISTSIAVHLIKLDAHRHI